MTKILLVDDQPVLVEMLSEILSSEGYDVTTHTDGLTALQQMINLRPDLVITDFSMPGMHGGALLTAMRENAYLSETPVLVLSGLPEYEIGAACDGYAAYIRKPAEPLKVLETIRRLTPASAHPSRSLTHSDALLKPIGQTAGAAIA